MCRRPHFEGDVELEWRLCLGHSEFRTLKMLEKEWLLTAPFNQIFQGKWSGSRGGKEEGVVLGMWDVSASQLPLISPSLLRTDSEQVLCYKPFLVWPICSQPYSTSYFHFITIHSFALQILNELFCGLPLATLQNITCKAQLLKSW